MEKRTIVVTGASSGVGLAAAQQFAARGDDVIVVGRDKQRLATAVELVRDAGQGRVPDAVRADFAVLDDVRALAAHLLATYPRIDVLANNAGGIVSDYTRTVDGFEATMQGNHLAPFLLTGLLRERLRGGRVVNTASDAHRWSRLDPADLVGSPGGYSRWRAYGSSKAANILFTVEAQRRWADVTSVSFHPGTVRSNFGTGAMVRLFFRIAPLLTTPEQAGAVLCWLADTPADQLHPGGYYVGRTPRTPASAATDPVTAGRLWQASARAVGLDPGE